MKAHLNHFVAPIFDRLIVGGHGYFSFAREGPLNPNGTTLPAPP